MMSKIAVFWISLCVAVFMGTAQPSNAGDDVAVITAENIRNLNSVMQIDFADSDFEFNTGWFAMTFDGQYYAVRDVENTIHVWDVEGDIVDAFALSDAQSLVVAMAFDTDGELLVAMDSDGLVVFRQIEQAESTAYQLFDMNTFVQQLWLADDALWVEAVDINGVAFVMRYEITVDENGVELVGEGEQLEYAPAGDADAVVRIGRIAPPFVVTSSQDGVVKRWDMQTVAVTAEVQAGDEPAVFGQITADGSHLTWRDQFSEALYLLDFETGENRLVAPLDGEYVQYFLLPLEADVIIAAHIEDRPEIIAWDVASGERFELGEHRTCNRVPDLIALSMDGTTMVVGCDTGLDIWRVVEPGD